MSKWATLQERIAGKWQIPLLLVSLALLGGALMRMRPAPADYSLAGVTKILDGYLEGAAYDPAIDAGENLLADEEFPRGQRAAVYLRLARARYGQAVRDKKRNGGRGRQILDDYEAASSGGETLTAADHRRMGKAFEWSKEPASALAEYELALAMGGEDRLELLLDRYTLAESLGQRAAALMALLAPLLDEIPEHRLDLRLWAIGRQIELLEASDRLAEASTLLVKYADLFRDSDLSPGFNYYQAYLLYSDGRFDQAETALRAIRNGVSMSDPVHAQTGWLLGRLVLDAGGPGRPYEAESFFSDVLTHHAGDPYALASRVGRAEALDMVGRYDEAIEEFTVAAKELDSARRAYPIDRDALRIRLGILSQERSGQGLLRTGLGYAELASILAARSDVQQVAGALALLGQTQASFAEDLLRRSDGVTDKHAESVAGSVADSVQEAREFFAAAAATHVRISQLHALNESVSADASWRAAELYTSADQLDRAAAIYRAFVAERPTHPLVPRALLNVGRLLQAGGDLAGAIGSYRICYRRFPRTLEGSRALIPLARCYLALGGDEVELAEKTLQLIVADSEVFTPRAPEFADALFLLGEVYNRRGQFESSISALDEALTRYTDDPRSWPARELLADSYRQSGLALKADVATVTSASEIDRIRTELNERFDKARELYRSLIEEYGARGPASLDLGARVGLRHAYLYEADCYFEVGRYEDALQRYEEASGMYKDAPAALAAYVQIINCHVFLGRTQEARAALARARVLVSAIPQEDFDRSLSPESREDWTRYLDWLGEAELF